MICQRATVNESADRKSAPSSEISVSSQGSGGPNGEAEGKKNMAGAGLGVESAGRVLIGGDSSRRSDGGQGKSATRSERLWLIEKTHRWQNG